MSNGVVVVVAGGEPPSPDSARLVPPGAPVVVADGGLELALALGLEVDVAVGDFDSATAEAVASAESAGARIVRHPADKDATDLELALVEALAFRPTRILVLAGTGDRLDHLLSLLLTLGASRFAEARVDAAVGTAEVNVVRDERTLTGRTGELVSLLAVHGPAEGVRTEGLVYELRGETLEAGSSRGVSNVLASDTARVSLERGALLVVRPGVVGGERE